MNSFCKRLIFIFAATVLTVPAGAQVKFTADTLECHIVSFSAGVLMAGAGSNSSGLTGGNMKDLYGNPSLDFALEWAYKHANGWLGCLDVDIWFGLSNDNLRDRDLRMPHVFNAAGYTMAVNGEDAVVTAYNRALSVRPGVGRIIRLIPKNPNSGLLIKVGGGWMMQKTVFYQDFNHPKAYQLEGDYAKLYDHKRNGVILTESVGFFFMSNYMTYANFKVTFDLSQCWSWSSRSWQIDNMMGLNGKEEGTFFDLLYSIRLTWMFPFTGKTTYDYYYY